MVLGVLNACGARTGLEVWEDDVIPPRPAGPLREGAPRAGSPGEGSLPSATPARGIPPAPAVATATVFAPAVPAPATGSVPMLTATSEVLAPTATSPSDTLLADGECEAGDMLIHLVTLENELYGYDPESQTLISKGTLGCDSQGFTPYSMGVNRFGVAYVLYEDSQIYRVSTEDASCEATDFVAGFDTFRLFGMGFVRNLELQTDELFVTDIQEDSSQGLATIDVETWDLRFVASYPETVGRMEMTGSSDGRLYGYATDLAEGGRILQIEKTTGALLEETPLPVGADTTTLAFAFFRGDFYAFTGSGGSSAVHRYRPSNGELSQIATIDRGIVGAGVTTCDAQ
jgi:hypothetical protein